jgi:hypothetical protein
MSDLKPCTICGGHLLLRTDHTIEIHGAETILEAYLRDIHAERDMLREALEWLYSRGNLPQDVYDRIEVALAKEAEQ